MNVFISGEETPPTQSCDLKISGIGVSIVANKVPGVRCAHCHDSYCAEFTRLHNDSNVLALGEKVVGEGYALKIVDTFLNTEFHTDDDCTVFNQLLRKLAGLEILYGNTYVL